ncbi:CaiB/BaiF CoA transferase family protein [Streptomyces sp. NPDC050161]|uniref:CaiB/BaiF CoA transferase family protein n=1 Tax=Streptomyces sp. NPDC050161 TaxID=3365604 RepID=UPI00378EB6E5
MPHVLQGLQAVDLTERTAGPLVGMFLADFGAEVVKVERPGGDPARSHPGFAVWNRGKKSVVVDPADPKRRDWLRRLVEGADICLVRDEAALAGFGLDAAAVRRANPRLVLVCVPPYAASGAPWFGGEESHGLLGAASGMACRQASLDGDPVEWVMPQYLYVQGVWATACTVAALLERESSGRGQQVTVTGLNAVATAAVSMYTVTADSADPNTAVGLGGRHPTYTRHLAGDGKWLGCGGLGVKFETKVLQALGLSGMLDAPRMGGSVAGLLDPANIDWATARIKEVFLTHDRDHWLRVLTELGIPCGPLQDSQEWLDHPQPQAIGLRTEVQDPERGTVTMPGVPLTLTRTPGRVAGAAPELGAHDAEADNLPRPKPEDAPEPPARLAAGPLAGYRIADLGTFVAAPFAGHLLAELGADVVKVEPVDGDPFRATGYTYNRGMRSLALDLQSSDGQETFHRLAATCDAVLHALRPGVSQKLRLDHTSLTAAAPSLVTASLSGYGEGGPLGELPGVDMVIQAMAGMMSRQGGDGEPVSNTLAIIDTTSAAMGALTVVLGLYHRARTGEGQRAWYSLVGTATYLQSDAVVRYPGRPAPETGSTDHRGHHPLDGLCRTADGWIRIAAADPASVTGQQLTEAGIPLDHGLFAADPTGAVRQALAGLNSEQAVDALTVAGIPAVRARKITEVLRDEDLLREEFVHVRPCEDGPAIIAPGRYATFSRTQRTGPLQVPGPGEHSRALLASAGLAAERVTELLKAGVVREGGPMPQRLAPLYR